MAFGGRSSLSAANASRAVNGLFGTDGRVRLIGNAGGAVRDVTVGTASMKASSASFASDKRLSPATAAAASQGSFVTCSNSAPEGRYSPATKG